jgi:ribonuclease I
MLYSYYILAIQNWCTIENKIHGLWADLTPTSYPTFCTNTPFDLDQLKLSPKYEEILDKWSDCTYEQTIVLYEHEWAKHGTCISLETGFSQNEYFEKTLELYNEFHETTCFDLDFQRTNCTDYA